MSLQRNVRLRGPDFVVVACTCGDVCFACAAVGGGLFIMLCMSSLAKPLLSQHRAPLASVLALYRTSVPGELPLYCPCGAQYPIQAPLGLISLFFLNAKVMC